MKHSFWLPIFIIGSVVSAQAVVSPRHGGALPEAYFDVKSRDATAFQMRHAWIERARTIRSQRESHIRSRRFGDQAPLPADLQISGSFEFPVLLGAFFNRPAPFESGNLQTELFDGPWPTGTLSDYFDEISYGVLGVGGVVADWVVTFQQDLYYEGSSNGLLPNDAKTGEFIKELLDANDGSIDFGQFDNDGPDGIPNSGDDDGYVDFVVFVHSEFGGECDEFSLNIWSHSWVYRGWPISGGQPYTTDDPAVGGGFVKIDDYSIQPAQSCGGSMIEIGSFCHEVGHAFGLPDLFDGNGGSSGAGHWDLMGRGNWNTPESPAHPSAWARQELGWVVPVLVGWQGAVESIPHIETNAVCFKLPFTDERFGRMSECSIEGGYSLRCAVDSSVAATRHWEGGSGYGNAWRETVEREFHFDGALPVWFTYDYQYDLEFDADSAFVIIEVDGVETTLASLTGAGSGTANTDLSPVLSTAAPPAEYRLKFRVVSDRSWSDEDGKHLTVCGAMIVDNISVVGGGENYSTNFESSIDGWYQDPKSNSVTEYWLVENRQPIGFDTNLHNSGLLIWHVDDEVIRSALGNTGGSAGTTVRGLVLEEADGMGHLLQDPETTGNEGDDGDPFPGSAGNTTFDSSSNPNSNGNSGNSTRIEVSGIGPSGPNMTAFLRAGDPGPVAVSAVPDVINNDLVFVDVALSGAGLRHGATFWFEKTGEADMLPKSIGWIDEQTLQGRFHVYSRRGGQWDLIVENPDGQQDALPDAITMVQIVAAQLVSSRISVHDGSVELLFELFDKRDGEVLLLSRAITESGPWKPLDLSVREIGYGMYRFVDETVAPGKTYHYMLEVRSSDGGVRELYRGSVLVPPLDFGLEQNTPNPFNPSTTIRFSLPETSEVSLEIFDVSGARVAVVATGVFPAGRHERVWDGKDAHGQRVGSGVYICRLQSGKRVQSRKMVVLK
ncbi:MAG: M6 family metalloprotease domain-containing protein [Candidatus Latescibacterota bacterium]|nr:MAG: M6 family metalloprotease domain-containing protein [Candidatus Latescibacterota bacterium]